MVPVLRRTRAVVLARAALVVLVATACAAPAAVDRAGVGTRSTAFGDAYAGLPRFRLAGAPAPRRFVAERFGRVALYDARTGAYLRDLTDSDHRRRQEDWQLAVVG